jgi:hypothetical protein
VQKQQQQKLQVRLVIFSFIYLQAHVIEKILALFISFSIGETVKKQLK